MAFLPTRRSWRRFSHAPPAPSAFGEPANQRHDSCELRSVASVRVSRATVAPPLRRFASARYRLRRRRSRPSILQERRPWCARSRRHVSTAVTPVADRESLLRTRRGNRRAGRPRATFHPAQAPAAPKTRMVASFSASKPTVPSDRYPSLHVPLGIAPTYRHFTSTVNLSTLVIKYSCLSPLWCRQQDDRLFPRGGPRVSWAAE